ncbi:TetR/AcrR family transcriptional regulator C-terminal domain-containing protein [Goodfellowiella coeruleoviolacea]|uniref:Transcriptional regulator, TetR family n=1 Tax=Goodfellowiella coeruleoviolacea TaxID=334858 RepID=A0AAE3GDK7_9PSEU|nr:TetR/AcrR family transcriptional regulator C-terminal domain-containing protein [Goodfellowiella coeruleoviolacea]MCP2165314.1 transcriptional regulator, TetR family [Goodfellowiella coeruleoviolacea]
MPRTDRPGLSRDQVLAAALRLVDRDGVAGLTMRRLGAELGVEAATLYYHVPNKADVLNALVDRAVVAALAAAPPGRPADWPVWLRELAVALRAELLRHPNLLPLAATRPVVAPAGLASVERVAAALCAAGFSPRRALHLINIVATTVLGHTLAEAGHTPGHEDVSPDTEELATRIDRSGHPVLRAAVAAGLGRPDDDQARFELAMDALFTGLVARARPDA